MAISVAWNGYGRVATANNGSETWAALKISGTGGGPSPGVADGAFEGLTAVDTTVNKQRVALYVDIGSGNTLNFNGGGSEEGQLVYIWVNFLAAPLLNNRSAGGLGVFLESSAPGTTQYHLWYFDGADTYNGGWKRYVLDPTKTVSASAGTAINLGAVRYFGVFADVGGRTAKFANLNIDAIDVGTGITVTGSSTTDAMIPDILTNEATNRYGIVTSLNPSDSAVQLAGDLILGDTTAATASTLSDTNSKIFLAEPTYYNGTAVVASAPVGYASINCVGGTGTNSITIGKTVGTDSGRNGWSVVGNDTYDLSIDFDDGNVNTSEWVGCSFEKCTGTLSWGTNTAHKCFANNFTNCAQFDPTGGVPIRNCNFVGVAPETGANSAALLWNSSIDIKNSNFIANDDPNVTYISHGIEFPAASTGEDLDNLQFSGNEVGVWFSATTGNLVLDKLNGTNLGTLDYTDDSSGTVTVQASFALTVSGLINGCEFRIYDDEVADPQNFDTELDGTETLSGTSFVYTHDGTINTVVIQMIVDGYEEIRQRVNLTADPLSVEVFPIPEVNI